MYARLKYKIMKINFLSVAIVTGLICLSVCAWLVVPAWLRDLFRAPVESTENHLRRLAASDSDKHTLEKVLLYEYLMKERKFAEAEAGFKGLLVKNPDELVAMYHLGELYIKTGRFDEAKHMWCSVIQRTDGKKDKYSVSWRKATIKAMRSLSKQGNCLSSSSVGRSVSPLKGYSGGY